MNHLISFRIILIALLLISTLFAHEVTLTGTITDTVLIPGSGDENTVVAIAPAAGLNVSVGVGYDSNQNDQYFGTTDTDGTFHITINLPDSNSREKFRIITTATLPDSFRYRSDTAIMTGDTISKITLSQSHFSTGFNIDSVMDEGYLHLLMYGYKRFWKEGDSISLQYTLTLFEENAGILPFEDCGFNMQVRTTDGAIIIDSTMTCNFEDSILMTLLEPSEGSMYRYVKLPLPSGLSERFPAFEQNRTLIVAFSSYNRGIETRAAITVLPTDISSMLPTEAKHGLRPKINTIPSVVTLNRQGPLLKFTTPASASYTIDLFLPNGRLVSRVLDNVPLTAGRHTIPLHPDNRRMAVQTTLIARVTGNKGAVATLKLLW